MSDRYRIDSHKLMYHPGRVGAWLNGETIYPIYMEASPSGACNHRCTYCALDFMEYQKRFLKMEFWKERLSEMGQRGVKSIMYAGDGEPFLHPEMAEIIEHTKRSGIDAAITTNGVLFTPDKARRVLGQTEWIKVSINGGTAETYAAIHRCHREDFEKVMENMREAARLRKEYGYRCTLGMQLLLLPENAKEATTLAGLARGIGMDYLVIKPYSQHPQSLTTKYQGVQYSEYESLAIELEGYNTEAFQVIFRWNTMRKWDEGTRPYPRCLAMPFWSYIDAGGNVWGCSMYLNQERFLYGNLYEESFEKIWQGSRRRESLTWADQKLDPCRCRVNCRMDEVNRYLWSLKNPPEHVNFI